MRLSLKDWCIENNKEELLSEWDYEKNGDLTPENISYGSGKKVFWKCKLGHSWESEVKGRATKGRCCPICSNDKVLVGYNDFETWCKQNNATTLLEEWDYEKNEVTPKEIVFGYRKPIWWKCSSGHSFQRVIRFRLGLTGEVRNCPYCRGIKVVSGDKSLGTVAPHLLEEWNYNKNMGTPDDYTYGSKEYAWWKCKKCGNEWRTKISHRVNGSGCPQCSNIEISKKLMLPNEGESFLDIYPIMSKEWHPSKNGNLLPNNVKVGSNKKVWWICGVCGTEWEATVVNRSHGHGCPTCMREQRRISFMQGIIDKQGSLAENYPILIEEWDYERNSEFNPKQMSCGSEERVWWKCKKCGHRWQNTIVKRTKRNQGCPECRKELKTSFPEKAVYFYIRKVFNEAIENYRPEWLGKAEIDIYIPSLKLGIEYDGTAFHKNVEKDLKKNKLCTEENVTLIRIREPQCPILDNSSIDFQMISHKESDLEMVLNQVLEWVKQKYSILNMPVVDLGNDRGKIYELMNLQIKENSLMLRFPELSKEWHSIKNAPLTPDKIAGKSSKKVWWICSHCGNEWQATVISRSDAGTGCPVCAGKKK